MKDLEVTCYTKNKFNLMKIIMKNEINLKKLLSKTIKCDFKDFHKKINTIFDKKFFAYGSLTSISLSPTSIWLISKYKITTT